MGLLECASGASVWRGYDYYRHKHVVKLEQIAEDTFLANVTGSSGELYSVELHINHPRKSKCNCPRANGKRVTCKHIVAAYFTALPQEAERFFKEAMEYEMEEEKRQEELYDRVHDYVNKMKKNDLQQAFLQLLFDGPEWQYDRFIREHGLDDY